MNPSAKTQSDTKRIVVDSSARQQVWIDHIHAIYIYPYIIIDHHISRKTEINNFDKLGSKIHFGTMYIYIQQSLIRCTLAPKSTLVTPSGMTLGTRLPRLQAWFGDSNVGPKSSRWMIWEEPQPIYIMGLHGNLMDIDGNSWT